MTKQAMSVYVCEQEKGGIKVSSSYVEFLLRGKIVLLEITGNIAGITGQHHEYQYRKNMISEDQARLLKQQVPHENATYGLYSQETFTYCYCPDRRLDGYFCPIRKLSFYSDKGNIITLSFAGELIAIRSGNEVIMSLSRIDRCGTHTALRKIDHHPNMTTKATE